MDYQYIRQSQREQKKIEAEELKKAQKEQKQQQKAEQPSLLTRFNAFRDRLNERLSQPIGSKDAVPAPRPVRMETQAAALQEEKGEDTRQPQEDKPSAEVVRESTSEEKSRELMNLIYEGETPGVTEKPEEAEIKPEEVKAVEEAPVEVTADETEVVEEAPVEVKEDEARKEEEEKAPAVAETAVNKEMEESDADIIKHDEGILYSGDVEMSVEVPVNLVAVSKLYNYLQSTPDLKVLYTKGSWDKATTIMISIEKPLPIIDMISRIPGINVVAKTSHSESEIKGASASLLGTKKDEIKKISLNLTEG